MDQVYTQSSPHPLVSLFTACFSVILWLLAWFSSVVAFLTLSVPRLIYAILSYSLTLTLNFYSLAVIFVMSCIGLSFFIRYRYLNHYATLKEPPLEKPDAKELHPDVNSTEPPPAFHNYLDEFLQAIRVFGFLEKPVFHELARHLQTRRLIAGDSLTLDQDKSFYCVVDGTVQVFAQTGKTCEPTLGGVWEDEDMNGYQLLNEVGSGGTLSSLFTILSLFTEDVKIRWQDEREENPDFPLSPDPPTQTRRTRPGRADSDVSQLDLEARKIHSPSPSPAAHQKATSVSSSGSTVHVTPAPQDAEPGVTSPQLNWTHGSVSQPQTPRLTSPYQSRKPSPPPSAINQGTIARATVDTTLAVIPAEAFRRLTKKFPKASAHIVQVILTRFSRVTFNAAHKYLGLTTEVLKTEKSINDLATHPLPRSFYEGGGMQNLRQRFKPEGGASDDSTDSETTDYFTHDLPSSPQPSLIKTPRVTQIMPLSKVTASPAPRKETSPPTPFKPANARNMVNAGDLHTMTGSKDYRPLSRTYSALNTPHISRDGSRRASGPSHKDVARLAEGDFDLRDEVMSCIAKSIGLLQPPLSGTESVEASPMPFSDAGLQRSAMFNSSFGSLSLLETGDDASSMTGGSSVLGPNMSGLDNEVEILFFAAGSSLVRAGERNAGMFYVIDGFLDVAVPLPEETPSRSRDGSDSLRDPLNGQSLPLTKEETTTRPSLKTASSARSSKNSTSNPTLQSAETPHNSKSHKSDSHSHHKTQKSMKHLFTVKPGGIAGYLASLCGIASYVDIRAKTDAYVGFLPYHALERLLEKRPIVLLTLAKRLISLLSPLVLHIDSSLDWMQVNAGQVLWRPGEQSDSFYIVINGRLRALAEDDRGGVSIVAEYGQGDTVGELDVITSSARRTTLHAIRDTELARMPLTLFNAISVRHPQTTVKLLKMIASRVRSEVEPRSSVISSNTSDLGRNNFNLKTIAILPAAQNVPVAAFAKKLQAALESIGAPTSYLNQATVMNHLGRHAFTRMGKLKFAGWLAEQEQRYRTVLYVADSPVGSHWTQTCIRQADCIMVVGMGDDPIIGEFERLLLATKTTARKELVLLHPERSVRPGSTREWLKNRPWIHAHMHVELPGIVVPKPAPTLDDPAALTALKNLKDKVQHEIQKYRGSRVSPRPRRPDNFSDFARLARRLCGKSIGVVMGGGGARGISHLGVLRALEEYGIPIDHIGGTSIGAFVGGLYAREGNILSSVGRAKQFGARMSSVWRILSDVTWPVVAYTTGHEFNRSIYKSFYDLHIEDMWLPFFCNTSNILTSRMEIHETGYAWRFIRASMTLVGLLPPLCDNGNMLVDGGYIDNLPVSTMLAQGPTAVFAVDVGSLDDNSPRNFGDSVSGWWLLLNRWNPFSATRNIPAITEIQSRLAYVSSVKPLEEAKVMNGCLYMQMPVQEYGTLQFGKFEEIAEKGYHAALAMLKKWDEEGKLPTGFEEGYEVSDRGKKKGRSLRRNSI